MFASLANVNLPPAGPDGVPKTPPPPTVVKFPQCIPHAKDRSTPIRSGASLITSLQSIQRPSDVKPSLFEALGLHVVPDVLPEDLIPDSSYLPPIQQWRDIKPADLEQANAVSKHALNNGSKSPGVQTYLERENELSIDNSAAFRAVRRIPSPPGEPPCRLGNAYEFYKNLEYFSGYWVDTSLSASALSSNEQDLPVHLRTHVRLSNGSQLPGEYRQQLLTAFVKLVAYDFGCNVSFPRCEPRLQIIPPKDLTGSRTNPPSYFATNMNFIYRTPKDRASARSGIVEGPLAGISCRPTTGFSTETESFLDLAKEVVSVLLTAQQRAREGKEESRFGDGKWWTQKKRWGGGKGGSIGKEGEKFDTPFLSPISPLDGEVSSPPTAPPGPSPNKKPKKGKGDGSTMQMYDMYRKMLPPSPTWDRRARYCAIGKTPEQSNYDDVFLISSLNHHICIIRTRVPMGLLETLDGIDLEGGWEQVVMWRSRWYDLFLQGDRIEAMRIVWGMMAWLMREVQVTAVQNNAAGDGNAGAGDKMVIDS